MKDTRNSKRTKKAKVQQIRRILCGCCIVALLVGCGMIGMEIMKTQAHIEKMEGLQNMRGTAYAETATPEPSQTTDETTDTEETTGAAEPQEEAAPAQAEVPEATIASGFDENGNPIVVPEYQSLYDINNHMVAWLEAGPSINMPIMHYDNEHYLDHDFYGESDNAGLAFINEVCTVWPEPSAHLIIHGHNMRNGTVFGMLEEFYSDIDFVKSYPIVYLHFINEVEPTAYVPVAIYEASATLGNRNYFDMGNVFFESDEEFLTYAEEAKAISMIDLPFDVQVGDQLLSLNTCSYGYENGRFVVMCRALREGETVQDVMDLMKEAR